MEINSFISTPSSIIVPIFHLVSHIPNIELSSVNLITTLFVIAQNYSM